MSLRIIIIILALLSFLTTTVGGYLYYSSIKAFAFQEEQLHAKMRLESTVNHIESSFAHQQKAVKALAGLNEIKSALANRNDPIILSAANTMLISFQDTLQADVCYLMDRNGNTIASSNFDEPDSFVGKNYKFRPYFKEAMHRLPATYMALGVTSNKRGVYYSAPIYHTEDTQPVGVAVMKSSVDFIEKEFMLLPDHYAVLADPHGIVFASNNQEWLFRMLWNSSPETLDLIAGSRQFGNGPWDWLGFEQKDLHHVVDTKSDKKYLFHEQAIVHCPGWRVVFLHDLQVLSVKTSASLSRNVGYIVIMVSLLTGIAVMFLYSTAHHDIKKRRKAEKELEEARHYLEARVQERTADLQNSNIRLQQEIDERLRVEKELEKARNTLEKRVRERTVLLMKTYDQLVHAEKLGAIGKLSASIAHEFGNPIFGIRNLLAGLKSRATLKDGDRKMVDLAIKECNRVKDLLNQLKDFNRPSDGILSPIDIHHEIDTILQLCSKNFKNKNITVKKQYGSGVPAVMAVRDQFKQIILNLLNNAAEAIPEQGGIIEIKTESLGKRIGIYISDSGEGITPENMDNIFEPFFSTKSETQGTGLGLSVVYGILTSLKGEIDVASEPGRGSTFTITLPAA